MTAVQFIRQTGIAFALILTCSLTMMAQDTKPANGKNSPGPTPVPVAVDSLSDSILVTVVLKYQQDKNFAELRRILEAQGFWDLFPISDARVISWNIAIGLGHVVTLKMPASSIRRLNLSIQNGAWGAFNSEIFISYDYMPIWKDYIERREEAKEERDKN